MSWKSWWADKWKQFKKNFRVTFDNGFGFKTKAKF